MAEELSREDLDDCSRGVACLRSGWSGAGEKAGRWKGKDRQARARPDRQRGGRWIQRRCRDVWKESKQTGHELLQQDNEDGVLTFYIKKRAV